MAFAAKPLLVLDVNQTILSCIGDMYTYHLEYCHLRPYAQELYNLALEKYNVIIVTMATRKFTLEKFEMAGFKIVDNQEIIGTDELMKLKLERDTRLLKTS